MAVLRLITSLGPLTTLAVSKPSKQSPARNKGIELAIRANPSCASGVLFESILRSSDPRNGFHTANTPCSDRADRAAYYRRTRPEAVVPGHAPHDAI